MRSLEKWTRVLESHIESLNISQAKLKQCQQKIFYRFLNYVSSFDEADSKLIAKVDSNKLADPSLDGSINCEETDDNDETVSTPNELGGKVLSRNLGIEIIVAITHTDHISVLEKDHDYTEETFDFIQQAIRKFCLQLGASLFYVSSKVNKNCDLLQKYLAHRIYDLPFKANASVVERDAIFVPAGWDDEKKISILYDNIKSANPDDDYNSFIAERTSSGPAQWDMEVEIESDQAFLLRMQNDLDKQVFTPMPTATSPVQPRQNTHTSPVDTQQPGERVLESFFNSLLSKGKIMTSGSDQQET